MDGGQAEHRITQTSDATAEIVGFADDAALLEAMLAAVHARARAAIGYRQWLGLLSRRGDASASLFPDGERVDGWLAGPSEPPPDEVIGAASAAEHAVAVLARRLAASAVHDRPWTRALQRWQLGADALLLLAAVLAAELSPRLHRVLAYLGGDAARPGLIGDAAAALFGDGVAGALVVDRELARGAPLFDLGLVAARPIDQPLLRRQLAVAPRVVALVRGELAIDPALAHAITPITPAAIAAAPDVQARIAAVLARQPAVIGVVRAARDASAGERIAAVAGRPVWRLDARALADEGIERAVIREAVLFDAVLVIRIEPPGLGRDAWRAIKLFERLAARAPVIVDADDRVELEPLWSLPVIPLELPPLALDERIAGWTAALGPSARIADLDRVQRIQLPLDAMRRTAGALAALAGAGTRAPVLTLAIAQATHTAAPALVRPAAIALADLVGAPAVLDRIATAIAHARTSDRSVLALVGKPGTGKTAVAAAIAHALDAPALAVDFSRLADRLAELDRTLGELFAFAAAGGVAILDASDPVPPRRGFTAGPDVELLLRRLAGASGVIVLVARETSAIDSNVRRAVHELIELPALDAAARTAVWRRALAAAPDARALAGQLADLALSPAQIHRLAERALATGALALEAMRGEAQRLLRGTGVAPTG